MMQKNIKTYLIGLLGIALLLSGCGGGGGNNGGGIVVSIDPAEVSLLTGWTQQFSATVTGNSNTAVTWSVDPQTTGGSITPTGLYTAPGNAGTYHVIATSQADPTKFSKAIVNVVVPGGGGGHYYEGTITIKRSGLASNNMNYNEEATITNFKLLDGGSGLWVLTGVSNSTVTAYVANKMMDTEAKVDRALSTNITTKTSIMLWIHDNTYDLAVIVYAEGAIVTADDGTSAVMDWPIAVSPIQNQPLPADPSRITGSITDTKLANCEVTWDLVKK